MAAIHTMRHSLSAPLVGPNPALLVHSGEIIEETDRRLFSRGSNLTNVLADGNNGFVLATYQDYYAGYGAFTTGDGRGADFYIEGTGVEFRGIKYPNGSPFDVFVDGIQQPTGGTCYAPSYAAYQRHYRLTGLPFGVHRITTARTGGPDGRAYELDRIIVL